MPIPRRRSSCRGVDLLRAAALGVGALVGASSCASAQAGVSALRAGPPDPSCRAALSAVARSAKTQAPVAAAGAVLPADGFDGSLATGAADKAGAEGVRLAGIELPEDAAARREAAALLGEVLASPRAEIIVLGPADRWGRRPAVVRDGDVVANAELLARGLALARPGEAPGGCSGGWLTLEDGARRGGLGVWGKPSALLLNAEDAAGILAQEGRFVVVEGRVRGLGETKTRVYLNFGTVRGEDFAVVIQKRNLRRVEASGMRWTSWEGRRVRVRGTVVRTIGPAIEVESPDGIERLD
ncbi:MAG: nuclease [Alsobacter sp.]